MTEYKSPYIKAFMMDITKVFKGDTHGLNWVQGGYDVLRMPINCVIHNMRTGDEYFIFGRNENGIIYSNNCYGNIPTVMATRYIRCGLKYLYRRGCDCIDDMPQNNTTMFGCYRKHSWAQRRGDNCKWSENGHFRDCQYELHGH